MNDIQRGPWWDQPPRSIDTLIEFWPQPASNGRNWGPAAAAAENRPGWGLGSGWLWDNEYQAWLQRHMRDWQISGAVLPDYATLPYLKDLL